MSTAPNAATHPANPGSPAMNGAEALVRSLHADGVEVCFANPGTSEMQFVDALDRTRLMRCVLGLFEGVVTGAADGYARMAGTPAVSLLHLGPGLSNASANLHNAKRARTPMLTLVGEHASWHLAHDPPLASDIRALAEPVSNWVRTAARPSSLAADGMAALAAARSWPGKMATLIAPGDTGWDEGGVLAGPVVPEGPRPLAPGTVEDVGEALLSASATPGSGLLFVGGRALASPRGLAAAAAIAAHTGASLMCPTAFGRAERGDGLPPVERLAYAVDIAVERLAPVREAVMVEASPPVAFFGYPGKPSTLLPDAATVRTLADVDQDGAAALEALAAWLDAKPAPTVAGAAGRPLPAVGTLTPETLAAAVAHALPEGAIIVDEGITAGRGMWPATRQAPPHTWLPITGGAIGIGPPLAVGAAIAAPDRPVLALQADGSAMYTIQALWTQAREGANVTTVVFANRTYEILKQEMGRVGANPGPSALALVDLDRPTIDFVALARGMGVEACRVDCPRALAQAIAAAVVEPGPFLIEATL
ncbi:MAG: acetolactate synthase large subunit [Pseudomonadota bacterium]